MAKLESGRSQLFIVCSLLMSALFAFSASVQLDDPDWYFWLPLYATASVINLVNAVFTSSMMMISMRQSVKITLWLGLFLLTKVLVEDYLKGIAGFWSFDMRERVVREKFGSGLVIFSMVFCLQAFSSSSSSISCYPTKGMACLVGVSYGMSFVFYGFQRKEMKFI
ncbi:uncharacterized protein LOC124922430 [Impatiens glandulifera]|uniref:uncharacterized protein LOC124922430 n=1 Tax=Impatiens glandulifera TaxID=253017 RepID=UPI001FB09E23|nr:uncharacterized protein LOC124922430 [Impatiens glandulifera]